jgi:leucyl-tRNA synthetase
MDKYEPREIEPKWQATWERERAFYVENPEPGAPHNPRKSYVLEMLPYPSGTLHMGHALVYTLGDVLAHFHRRNGMQVLRPMGWDSFGLPAENAAINEGGHPREITERNITAIKRSMQRIGWAIDWDRELAAHDPAYYKWTQWLFLRFLENDLAYRKEAPVKWCPNDQTVLANEQVQDGRCKRCGAEVEGRMMAQWFFRTTQYADELLDAMKDLDWPERILAMQRHWIGRSQGAHVTFHLDELDEDVTVFTTRPDTLFGATFFVLAPEHPLVERCDREEVREYVKRAGAKRGEERAAAVEKTGVDTGWHVVNPVNGEKLPVYVADYVLMDYGTGAVMAVPAHDERDRAFAETYGLPIRTVVSEDGRLVDSGEFTGLPAEEGKRAIVEWLRERGLGEPAVNYRLRDWGFSRQRYWGCPIPIVYCDQHGAVPVPDEELPVVLPDIENYKPQGQAPLAQAEDWVNTTCPTCGGPARREVETMDTFVDSSWYFIRYCDPKNDQAPWSREIADYWGPVDHYTGGVDHATVHMIYARFFAKALNDMGMIGWREPFLTFFGNGWVQMEGSKMSKSRGNVIGPEQLVETYGADPVRLYILFIGPADQDMDWNEGGIDGMVRFVRRLWRVVGEAAERAPHDDGSSGPLVRKAHETIARVTDDVGRRHSFNTAISAVMELVNELASAEPDATGARFAAETAVSLIQPYAPHVAEELWAQLGHERLWEQPWPVADEAQLERDSFELVVQVNGKVRDRLEVPTGLAEDELVARARSSEKVQAYLDGKQIRKTVVVPDKLVNLVVG